MAPGAAHHPGENRHVPAGAVKNALSVTARHGKGVLSPEGKSELGKSRQWRVLVSPGRIQKIPAYRFSSAAHQIPSCILAASSRFALFIKTYPPWGRLGGRQLFREPPIPSTSAEAEAPYFSCRPCRQKGSSIRFASNSSRSRRMISASPSATMLPWDRRITRWQVSRIMSKSWEAMIFVCGS